MIIGSLFSGAFRYVSNAGRVDVQGQVGAVLFGRSDRQDYRVRFGKHFLDIEPAQFI
jgi:hypothetical protein